MIEVSLVWKITKKLLALFI